VEVPIEVTKGRLPCGVGAGEDHSSMGGMGSLVLLESPFHY